MISVFEPMTDIEDLIDGIRHPWYTLSSRTKQNILNVHRGLIQQSQKAVSLEYRKSQCLVQKKNKNSLLLAKVITV